MIQGKRLIVDMPAYNAERTLRQTYEELPHDYIDDVILVDDSSRDGTVRVAQEMGIHTILHLENRGYGGNQKSCYLAALRSGADIVVMIHPDYQYSPRLVTALASMVASWHFDIWARNPGDRREGAGCRSTKLSQTGS
jgi:glycosyltransferase involved in cell wall biosynthesis